MAHSLEELKKVQERRNEVKIRTEDGENVQSIAVSMGISETTVTNDRRFLKKHKMLRTPIEKRRDEVKKRTEEGESIQQIADALNILPSIVEHDREILRKQGRLNFREEEIAKRRDEVNKRSGEGETEEQIADELGISIKTVQNDKAFLREQKILKEPTKVKRKSRKLNLKIQERREEVKERTQNNETNEQIAQALEVSIRTIEEDKKFLVEQGRLKKETKTERRRKEVKRRIKMKETKEQIARALRVTVKTIENDIRFLNKERQKEVKRRMEENETEEQIAEALDVSVEIVKEDIEYISTKTLSREERLDEEEKLIKAKMTVGEIAERMNMHPSSIKQDRKYLKEQKRITGKEKSITKVERNFQKRLKRLERLLREEASKEQKKTKKQMAKELNVSVATIEKDIRILREQKEQEFAEWSKEIIKRYEKFYGQSASIKRFEQYLTLCKERYEQTLIEEEHLLPIKYAAIATETYSNIAFYIKLCIRFNQFEEAMKFAKSYVSCETFSQEEKGKIKKSIVECEKFCQAIRMINNPAISDETIRQVTGLSKVEIALLRKKAEKRANGDSEIKTKEEAPEVRKHEENDDGDELERA